MTKCGNCGNVIELGAIVEDLVAIEEQKRGTSLDLLCPDCQPADYINPISQLLEERKKNREQRKAMNIIEKATTDQWCDSLESALAYLENLWEKIDQTEGKILMADLDKYSGLYTRLSVIVEDLNPEELGTLFTENIIVETES